ncbi:MAG: serine hydrolase domain-containing protein [Spirochaetia bacterium]|jgi:CubicO group peptidase (beta-lactamase class C family)|nr:serine hydrolase domain-containing protein [Spirochaetia bacterium]
MQSKRIFTRLLLLFILALGIYSFVFRERNDTPKTGSFEDWAKYMGKKIPGLMADHDIPGLIIAFIQDGKTVWIDSYGYADLENKIPMTIDTRCRVESISKSVTAWGVMKLVTEGKIDLEKTLASYLKTWSLPESLYSEEKVTIRQLLNHNSGMPLGTLDALYDPEDELPSLREFLKSDAILFQEPGISYSYSNVGYNLLELLIEEVTERDFAQYMSDEILDPLGMYDSSFTWSHTWKPEIPKGYDINGRAVPVYIYPNKASGGLFSTAGDIASFVSAGMKKHDLQEQRVLNGEAIGEIYNSTVKLTGYYSQVFDGYSFGHFIETLDDGTFTVSNGGQGSGWMSYFQSVPETGNGIVMLSNSQRSWPLFSSILTDWSGWSGIPSVGMSVIKRMSAVLRISLAILYFITLAGMILTVISLRRGKRQFFFVKKAFRGSQLVQITLSVMLTAVVTAVSQMKYFFLNSVFPVETPWLAGLVLAVAGLLFFLAMVPQKLSNVR